MAVLATHCTMALEESEPPLLQFDVKQAFLMLETSRVQLMRHGVRLAVTPRAEDW
jgi:hypothetical protein